MLRPPPTRTSQQLSPLRRRVLTTIVVAFIGTTVGLIYARFTLSDEQLSGNLPAMYGTLGAVIAVLGVRLTAILRAILSDYFGSGA